MNPIKYHILTSIQLKENLEKLLNLSSDHPAAITKMSSPEFLAGVGVIQAKLKMHANGLRVMKGINEDSRDSISHTFIIGYFVAYFL